MLDKVLLKLLGGIWGIKRKCMKNKNEFLIHFYNKYLDRYGSYIGYDSRIEGTPIFPHGLHGIFISGSSKIGNNCVIFQQVTIGSNILPDSKKNGSPTIGDNCYIGAGAKIIGNITIGDNVRIGANCAVVTDVPSNSIVVSQSARIIQKEHINNKYYSKNSNGEWVYMQNGFWIIEKDENVIASLS